MAKIIDTKELAGIQTALDLANVVLLVEEKRRITLFDNDDDPLGGFTFRIGGMLGRYYKKAIFRVAADYRLYVYAPNGEALPLTKENLAIAYGY